MSRAPVRRLLPLIALITLLAASRARADSDASPAQWRARVEEAAGALEAGDDETAQLAVARLQRMRPASPLPVLFEARRLEAAGHPGEAADLCRDALLARAGSLSRPWATVLSSRWVRAARSGEEQWVRAALARESAPAPIAGRALVLPLEPLVVEESPALARDDLAALGAAAAYWVLSAWREDAGGGTVGLHAALLLRRGQAPPEPSRASEDDARLAPITTMEGAALRLETLEPSGPPPWAADAPRPSRYLAPGAAIERPSAVGSALAHFQSEHGLAPTGTLDPETRQSLERAYRQEKTKRATRTRPPVDGDPALEAARLAGAPALLTGTLEAAPSGDLRWRAAWVSASDGSILSSPLSGVLPRTRFSEGWDRMVRAIRGAAPPADTSAFTPLAPPSREGAILFGRALTRLEQGDPRGAGEGFARAARAGAGSVAQWLADAWSLPDEARARLERLCVEEETFGPRRLDPRWVDDEAAFLARGVAGASPVSLESGPALRFVPERGWLMIIGRIE
jgi:hypothetical protein